MDERIQQLDKFDAIYANRHRWHMFVPENYRKIRADMDAQGINPDVIDIGCGAGFGSEFFLDGSYIGVDKDYPHIGFGNSKVLLGNSFFNQKEDSALQNKKTSFVIDTFPSEAIAELSKKKTLISSMSLGAYGETNKSDCKKIFKNYCECMKNADNIYICGPREFTQFVHDFFGGSKQIGEHAERSYDSTVFCPITHTKP